MVHRDASPIIGAGLKSVKVLGVDQRSSPDLKRIPALFQKHFSQKGASCYTKSKRKHLKSIKEESKQKEGKNGII
jgi:hypothetical protein